MAEVSVGSVVAPEKDELNDDNISKSSAGNEETLSNGRSSDARPRRASAGSTRSSAERSESGNSSQKVVSRYLRASTGSCHDLCKFGHSTETKEKKPFRKRSGKSLTKLSPDEIPVEILVSGGKKKKEVVASGGRKKEEVVLDVHGKADKKEDAVSGVQEKEEVVLDGQKKDEKKEEVVSGEQKKEEVVLGGQKEDGKNEEVVSGGPEKEEVVIGGPLIDTKDQSIDHKPSPNAKSLPTKPKTSLAKEMATKQKPSKSPNVLSRSKTNLIKPNLSTLTKSYSSKKNDSAVSKSLLPKFKPPSAKRSPSADPPEIVKSVCFPYAEVEDLVKQGSSTDDKTSRTAKKTTSVAKQKSSSPVKLKPVKVKPSSPSDDSGGMHGKGRTDSNAETGRKSMTAKASAKKVLAPPTATLSPKLSFKKTALINSGKSGNLKLVSPVKDRSRIRRVNSKESNSEKVTEKTLHVVAVENRNSVSGSIRGSNAISSPQSPLSADSLSRGKNPPLSSQEDNSDSEESAVVKDKATSKNSGSFGTGKEAPVKESPKKMTIRKNRVAVPEDNKHVSPVKMKFRMGKVMELQTDDNSPRRLRFRRARVLGLEEIKGDLRRRTSRKAAINTDTASAGNTSQKVVLKHQNVQGKKDAQGLLNNVIEETASKLAESRKSKVKALVGAFETVISLQETKPPTQVVT